MTESTIVCDCRRVFETESAFARHLSSRKNGGHGRIDQLAQNGGRTKRKRWLSTALLDSVVEAPTVPKVRSNVEAQGNVDASDRGATDHIVTPVASPEKEKRVVELAKPADVASAEVRLHNQEIHPDAGKPKKRAREGEFLTEKGKTEMQEFIGDKVQAWIAYARKKRFVHGNGKCLECFVDVPAGIAKDWLDLPRGKTFVHFVDTKRYRNWMGKVFEKGYHRPLPDEFKCMSGQAETSVTLIHHFGFRASYQNKEKRLKLELMGGIHFVETLRSTGEICSRIF